MYEESIHFFTDLFQHDASVLSILDADHTFVNEPLAEALRHSRRDGRRVAARRRRAAATAAAAFSAWRPTLAKQSGASRTSPILRGNWVSEVLLGEKLPRPPKDVPRLPEDETATEGPDRAATGREAHQRRALLGVPRARSTRSASRWKASTPIGRRRDKDLADRPIDTRTTLPDGTTFDGLAGLRDYLLNARARRRPAAVLPQAAGLCPGPRRAAFRRAAARRNAASSWRRTTIVFRRPSRRSSAAGSSARFAARTRDLPKPSNVVESCLRSVDHS